MNRIDAGTLVEEVVDRYPATKVVLSRYGLDAYEEAEPSRQSVSRFAEDRGMSVERLLEELNHVVDISLPPGAAPHELPLAAGDPRVVG